MGNLFKINGFNIEGFANKVFKSKESFSKIKDAIKEAPLSISDFTKSVIDCAKNFHEKYRDDISKGAKAIHGLCVDSIKRKMEKEGVGLEASSNIKRAAEDSLSLASKGEEEKNGKSKQNDEMEI